MEDTVTVEPSRLSEKLISSQSMCTVKLGRNYWDALTDWFLHGDKKKFDILLSLGIHLQLSPVNYAQKNSSPSRCAHDYAYELERRHGSEQRRFVWNI